MILISLADIFRFPSDRAVLHTRRRLLCPLLRLHDMLQCQYHVPPKIGQRYNVRHITLFVNHLRSPQITLSILFFNSSQNSSYLRQVLIGNISVNFISWSIQLPFPPFRHLGKFFFNLPSFLQSICHIPSVSLHSILLLTYS